MWEGICENTNVSCRNRSIKCFYIKSALIYMYILKDLPHFTDIILSINHSSFVHKALLYLLGIEKLSGVLWFYLFLSVPG